MLFPTKTETMLAMSCLSIWGSRCIFVFSKYLKFKMTAIMITASSQNHCIAIHQFTHKWYIVVKIWCWFKIQDDHHRLDDELRLYLHCLYKSDERCGLLRTLGYHLCSLIILVCFIFVCTLVSGIVSLKICIYKP